MRDNRRNARQFQNTYPDYYPGKKVKTVTFIVTHQCNLRCSYCYETHKGEGKMSLDTAKKCVDLLFAEDAKDSELVNDTDANGLIIEFISGEPFLEIGLIRATMDYFLDKTISLGHRWATRYMVNISTNGTLGDDPEVQAFLRKYAWRLSIGVTIDGDKQAHDACRVDCDGCGSYDRAITRQSQSEQKCLDCPINSGCAWCTAYNYERTGTPDKRVTYICKMHWARVLAQCYHHNKLHLLHPEHEPKRINIPEDWALEIIGPEEWEMLRELERECLA